VLAIESDFGTFRPLGFGVAGNAAAQATAAEIVALLDPIGAGTIGGEGGGADISPLMRDGVPGMGLNVDGGKYFWYHHTNADTPDKIDPRDLALCSAAIAVMAYVVADLPFRFGQ
jgi:carboxypeptidase Q